MMGQTQEMNVGPLNLQSGVLPTEHSGAGDLNGLTITFFPHEMILALKKYHLRLFQLAGVDLSVPKVDHGTNCIQLLNGMRERMTVKTRNQTLALESLQSGSLATNLVFWRLQLKLFDPHLPPP